MISDCLTLTWWSIRPPARGTRPSPRPLAAPRTWQPPVVIGFIQYRVSNNFWQPLYSNFIEWIQCFLFSIAAFRKLFLSKPEFIVLLIPSSISIFFHWINNYIGLPYGAEYMPRPFCPSSWRNPRTTAGSEWSYPTRRAKNYIIDPVIKFNG